MSDDKIKQWQDSLFAAFSYKGVLGGQYLGPVMDIEPNVGKAFHDKYYGHRVLTDSFMDFLGETIWKQGEFNNRSGWPQDREYYTMCLMMFLTVFRSFRAAELLSLHGGYPLQAYIIQRSLKDQVFAQDSGVSDEAQQELIQWNRLFNWEAHRGLLTMFRASKRVMDAKKFEMVLGPTPDELNETMYMNRCTEIGWMILRLLPFMRRAETPKDEDWNKKWKLLDDSFKMMVDGLGGLGKKIAPAITDCKFRASKSISRGDFVL